MADKPKRGRQLEPALSMKGTPKWRKWLEGWANHLGLSSSQAVDRALRKDAESEGYEPPPNRTGDET